LHRIFFSLKKYTWNFICFAAPHKNMNDADKDALPPLAELFLHIVLFVLPRDTFDCDRSAMLRLCRVRKNLVEQMHQCSGAFSLDLHMSAKHIVMMSPYPRCHLAYFDRAHFEAIKSIAARFQSVDGLRIDLQQLPVGCNFICTAQILDVVFHCLKVGKAKLLSILHAVFEAEMFTQGMRSLPAHTKDQILCMNLTNCGLDIDSSFLRELASMRNMIHLRLDGNKFHLAHSGFPSFSEKLESLSVANCAGVRPTMLKNVGKTLRTLGWSDNVITDEDKPAFFEWLKDSKVQNLEIDNCGFALADSVDFQAALKRMPALRSLSMAGNYIFQDDVFWWIYDFWRNGRLQSNFFSVHISNMDICYPDAGIPFIMSTARFGYVEISNWD
jgi:hypothetical protein